MPKISIFKLIILYLITISITWFLIYPYVQNIAIIAYSMIIIGYVIIIGYAKLLGRWNNPIKTKVKK